MTLAMFSTEELRSWNSAVSWLRCLWSKRSTMTSLTRASSCSTLAEGFGVGELEVDSEEAAESEEVAEGLEESEVSSECSGVSWVRTVTSNL